ncbi:MAG: hypothetical protein ACT4R6_03725, partial [Gemmatimonadaceae bacterium]
SARWEVVFKSLESLVAVLPLAVPAGYYLAVRRRVLGDRVGVALLGALASVALFVLFSIPGGRNEYKFMFTAALSLAPLAALGVEAFLERGGRRRAALVAGALLFLLASGADGLLRGRYAGPTPLAVRGERFGLRLADGHPLNGSLGALAERTPANTVVLVDSADVHVPVFARRALYAPPLGEAAYWGVGLRAADLLGDIRGYGRDVLAERRGAVRRLFESAAPGEVVPALRAVASLGRPVAVLLSQSRHRRLTRTLMDSLGGEVIQRDSLWAVWLWRPASSD